MSTAKKLMGTTDSGATAATVAFVAARVSDKLVALDISNPSSMSVLGTASSISGATQVAYDPVNKVAYVAGASLLYAVDASNPSSMSTLGSIAVVSGGNPCGLSLDVANGVAYVASTATVTAVDISTPSSMSVLDTYVYGTSVAATDCALDLTNSLLYVVLQNADAISKFDISTPSSISLVQTLSNFNLLEAAQSVALDVANNFAYIAAEGTGDFTRYTTSPSIGAPVTNIDTFQTLNMNGVTLDLVNQVAYAIRGISDAIVSFDISGTPSILSSFTIPSSISSGRVVVDNVAEVAYVTDVSADGVHAIDVSNPSSMSSLGNIFDATNLNTAVGIALNVAGPMSTRAYS